MKTDRLRHVAAFLGLAAFVVLALGSVNTGGGGGSGDSPTAEKNTESENSEQAQARMPVGSVGHLKSPGGDVSFLTVARTKEAQKEFSKTIDARDTEGLRLLVLRGEIFVVDPGTKVRILTTDLWLGTSEIRILEGKHYGESGWVFSQLVIP